ncbi:hypothetical protein DV735_g534, partial [Chaetothyriales sp. CBS 134920]
MFSLTPPPSEFDEVDRGQLLGCSPSLSSFTYPSPAPSHSGRGSLSEPAHPSQDGMPPFPDLHQSHSHELFFGDHPGPSFMPGPTLPEQVAQFQPPSQAYGLFPPNSWIALSYQAAVSSYAPPPSSIYPALERPCSGIFRCLHSASKHTIASWAVSLFFALGAEREMQHWVEIAEPGAPTGDEQPWNWAGECINSATRAWVQTKQLGGAHIQAAPLVPLSAEVATYASTTTDTRSISSAGSMAVRSRTRPRSADAAMVFSPVDSAARKTERGMKQSTIRESNANGKVLTVKRVDVSLAAWIT